MTDFRKQQLPPIKAGPMNWQDFGHWFETWQREIAAKQDPRNPNNDFSGAFVATNDGKATIGDAASISTQRTLPVVNAGNRASAQTTNPLGSVGTASTASISIASHVIQYGGFSVSYNGGTISGLNPLVTYYVYADDPDYSGGAVAYAATTDFPTVVASRNRYYVGQITTANSTPAGNVTAATSANPIQLTSTLAGSLSSGQQVIATGFTGDFAALNNNTYTVTVLSGTDVTIPVDGSLFAAWTSGGTITRVSPPSSGGGGGGSGWSIP